MLATAVKGFAEMKKQEGIKEARLEDAKRLKEAGVKIETIVTCIDIPREVIEKL